jgi:hypothetical protein
MQVRTGLGETIATGYSAPELAGGRVLEYSRPMAGAGGRADAQRCADGAAYGCTLERIDQLRHEIGVPVRSEVCRQACNAASAVEEQRGAGKRAGGRAGGRSLRVQSLRERGKVCGERRVREVGMI